MTPIPQYLSPNTLDRVYQYMRSLVEEGNYKVLFKTVSQRTIEQNAKIHALCTDIGSQVILTDEGYKHINSVTEREKNGGNRVFDPISWKHILMAGFSKAEVVPGIEPDQVVCLYPSTTELSLSRGSDFIEYIYSVGADYGVEWNEDEHTDK